MTIEEAMKHCEEVAEVNHKMVESLVGIDTDEQERCRECAKDHEQLDEWLKELKAYKENTCGDAISRDELLKAMDTWDKFGYTETGCFVREPKNDCVKYIHYDDVIKCIKGMPSVTPQQKMGRWVRMSDLSNDVDDRFECSCCGNVVHYNNVMNLRTFSRWCGRCGSYNG